MVTLPNGNKIPFKRLRICRDFAAGSCTRAKCMFPHVTGLPASLQERALSKEGLTLCSLCIEPKGDGVEQHHFDAAKEQQVLAGLETAKESGTAGSIDADASGEWTIEGMDGAALQALLADASGSPFGGPEA